MREYGLLKLQYLVVDPFLDPLCMQSILFDKQDTDVSFERKIGLSERFFN